MNKNIEQDSYLFVEDEEYESLNQRSSQSRKKRRQRRIGKVSIIAIVTFFAFVVIYQFVSPYLPSAAGSNNQGPKDNMFTSLIIDDEDELSGEKVDGREENEKEPKNSKLRRKVIVENPKSIDVLVNKQLFLPDGYEPEDLVVPEVEFSFSGNHEKSQLREEAAKALEELFEASKSEGLKLYAVSGYRSYRRQYDLFRYNVRKDGLEKTLRLSALPGTSEHQTGLAMDISTGSVSYLLNQKFGQTPEGKWLADNAHKFGYIIRYPEGKELITGYSYEPWHLRYVGKELAKHLYENDLTLEEYYEFEIDPLYYEGFTYDNIEDFGIDIEGIDRKSVV